MAGGHKRHKYITNGRDSFYYLIAILCHLHVVDVYTPPEYISLRNNYVFRMKKRLEAYEG